MPEPGRPTRLPLVHRSPVGDVNQAGFAIDRDTVWIRHPRLGSLQQPHRTFQFLRVFLKGHHSVVVLDGQ